MLDSNFDFRTWEVGPAELSSTKRQLFPLMPPVLIVIIIATIFVVLVMNAGGPVEELDQFARQWGIGP